METGNPVAEVYNRRGGSGDLPPQWLIYVKVDDVEANLQNCLDCGKVWKEAKVEAARLQYAVIKNPTEAVLALI